MNEEVYNKLKSVKPELNRFGIVRMRLFGSQVRDDHTPNSDVDLLLDFEELPSLFTLVDIQEHIENHIDACVDIAFAHKLIPELKDKILSEAVDV